MTKDPAYPLTAEDLGFPWGLPEGLRGPTPAEQEAQKIPLLVGNLPHADRPEHRYRPVDAVARDETPPSLDFSTAASNWQNRASRQISSSDPKAWFETLDRDKTAARAMAHALALPPESLQKARDGCFVYQDSRGRGHTLGTMRALRAGRSHFARPEYVTWHLRLIVEAGLRKPMPVAALPLPSNADTVVRKVYEGFCFLLGCRWLHTPGDPAPFTREFAAAWCSVSVHEARSAIDELLELGLIDQVEKMGRLRLWLPAKDRSSFLPGGDPGECPRLDLSSCGDNT